MPRLLALGLFAPCLVPPPGLARADGPLVRIESSVAPLPGAVCELTLDEGAPLPPLFQLVDDQGAVRALGQVYQADGKRRLALRFQAGSTPREGALVLRASDQAAEIAGIGIDEREGDVRFTTGGEPFTIYRDDAGFKPYFWPLIGPTGDAMTRAWPMARVEGEDRDHFHQRSLWFTHGDVNGVDFWASDAFNRPSPNFGTIRETDRAILCAGPVVGVLRTKNDWCGPDGKVLCRDVRTVRAYAGTASKRILDFDLTIQAGPEPVTFGDTKEGCFGLRVASSMDVNAGDGGKITNAEGITDGDAWGKRSPWVDYTGPVAGKTVGIAILNHPDSFRYPTAWHVRDYGLFAANPFGYHDFGIDEPGAYTLPPGQSITLRYRLILHAGTTDEADIAGEFATFERPPTVTVQGG